MPWNISSSTNPEIGRSELSTITRFGFSLQKEFVLLLFLSLLFLLVEERERANVSLFTKCDFLSKRDWVGCCSLSRFFPWVFQIFSSVQHHPFSWHIWASNFPFPLLHIQIPFFSHFTKSSHHKVDASFSFLYPTRFCIK